MQLAHQRNTEGIVSRETIGLSAHRKDFFNRLHLEVTFYLLQIELGALAARPLCVIFTSPQAGFNFAACATKFRNNGKVMLNEQKINDQITIGGALSDGDAQDLENRGFKTVVNLMMPDEPQINEEAAVKGVGLTYAPIPISPATLDEIAVARFLQAVESSEGPVAVHCKGGGRAGLMTLIQMAIEHGWTLERALEEGEKLKIKIGGDSPYRPFFESYIRAHSSGER